MAEIHPSTKYRDSSELDPNQHTNNIHSHSPQLGIMSEANGRLDSTNLAGDFTIDETHIMREQAALARAEGMRKTTSIYANGVPTPDNEKFDSTDPDKWFVVPGCSLRWYQPYDASATLIHWTVFMTTNRWSGWAADIEKDFWRVGPEAAIICAVDGSLVPSTRRYLPPSMFHPISPGGAYPGNNAVIEGGEDETVEDDKEGPHSGNPRYVDSAGHASLHWDLSYLTDTVTKGFHELSVYCRIESVRSEPMWMQIIGRVGEEMQNTGHFTLTNCVSFGIRGARVLTLL